MSCWQVDLEKWPDVFLLLTRHGETGRHHSDDGELVAVQFHEISQGTLGTAELLHSIDCG